MADYREKIKKYFDKEIGVIQHLDIEAINKVMNVIAEARQREATIYTMGLSRGLGDVYKRQILKI